MKTILSVRGLSKSFGAIHAVQNCRFSIDQGSITGLIGPNGAGKTTVFNMLTGLLHADSGTLELCGENITAWPAYKRAQAGLARTFQMIRIFPNLTVLENLKVALKDNKQGFRHIFVNQKKLQRRLDAEAKELLKRVHLEDHAHLLAGELSYGQQKLLEILRTVAMNPKVILLDEPAAGINRTLLQTIIKLIYELQKEGKTIIVIEHDMGFIMEICEKIIVMNFGKEIAEGTPEEIQKNPQVLEAYLGQTHA
ncbi:hypothetical protein A3J23_03180 [Candidatus Peregrinibacteria bacterium RIFCSPLOWO2_02_FULL_48_14]|nr:MAG: hypothetical protein A3J23_03180 [Candidatus Peregrinibacteria bacterium RIFCSPLOWO2_02_FULL_48_14]